MTTLDEFRRRYSFNMNSKPLGSGGFGKVYKGIDTHTNQEVAIKKCEVTENLGKYSLLEEVKVGQSVRHPNLVEYQAGYRFSTNVGVFDFGVMEFINGGNLSDFMKTFPSMEKIDAVLVGILNGLNTLHQQNIIHRDLKPANILIHYENGKVIPKIIDFGISKVLSREETEISNVIGSYEYMSPEQLGAAGGQITTKSDMWSFGVILYQLLRGDLPFGARSKGHTSAQIIHRVISARHPADLPKIAEPHQTIIKGCFVKDYRQRLATPSQIIDVLEGKPTVIDANNLFDNQVSVEQDRFKSASLGKRFAAYLLDTLITIGLFIPGFFITLAVEKSDPYDDDLIMGTFFLTSLLPAVLYALLKEGFGNGQSWGKKAIGLQTIKTSSSNACSKKLSFIRNLFFYGILFGMSHAGLLFLIIIITEAIVIYNDDKNRGVEDLIFGTRVISIN